MKKQAFHKSVLAVALGVAMVTPKGFAESFDEYQKNFASTLPIAKKALNDTIDGGEKPAGKLSIDELQKQLDEVAAKLQEKGLVNGKRKELLAEENRLRKLIDDTQRLKNIKPALDARVADEAKRRTLELKDAEAFAQALDTSSAFIDPSQFSNDMDKSCSNGVDFTQSLMLVQQIGQKDMETLKQQASLIINKSIKTSEKLEKEKILAFLNSRREALASKDSAEGAKLSAEEFAKIQTAEELEEKIANIKKIRVPKWENQKRDAEENALTEFADFSDKLFKLRGNDREVRALVAGLRKKVENKQQQLMQLISKPATALFDNCTAQVQQTFADINNTAAYMQQSGFAGSAASEAQLKANLASSMGITPNGGCTDRTADLQAIIGGFNNGQLQTALDNMAAQTSIEGAFAAGVEVMDQLRFMQQSLGPVIQEAKDECTNAAKVKAAVIQRSQQVASMVTQNTGRGVARSQGQARTIGAPTHNQLAGR